MTATAQLTTAGARASRRQRLGILEWSFIALPVLFLAGLAGFLWVGLGLACAFVLLGDRRISLPAGALTSAALVGWIAITSIPVIADGSGAVLLSGFRFAVFLAVPVLYLFVVNHRDGDGVERAARIAMTSIWCTLVVCGLVSMIAPTLTLPSLAQMILPRSLLANSYLSDLTQVRFSEIQIVLGEASARPSAPFAYANGWGSAFVMSTPFAWWNLVGRQVGGRRLLGLVVMAVGILVAIASLNRAVWALLVVMIAYGVMRSPNRARLLLVGVPLAVGLTFFALQATALGDRVDSRLEVAEESNRARSAAVVASIDAANASPVIGFGAPLGEDSGVPVGTHGLAWFLMVSHGFPALALLSLFLGGQLWRGWRSADPASVAAHATVLVTVLQLPVYGLLPQLPLVSLACAVLCRPSVRSSGSQVTDPRPAEVIA